MIGIVIPARLGSTRLPRKPLQKLGEYPLLWWTWQKALQSKVADKVIIATDSEEIYQIMSDYGAICQMTSESCESGTDRVFEVSQAYPEIEVIVNLQGDEPLMPIEVVDRTVDFFQQSDCHIATTAIPFRSEEDRKSPNHVKVVMNSQGRALYFSRANMANAYLHLGLYVYGKEALKTFCELDITPLERAERLEQLRALENGMNVYVFQDEGLSIHFGIDTEDDLKKAYTCVPDLKKAIGI